MIEVEALAAKFMLESPKYLLEDTRYGKDRPSRNPVSIGTVRLASEATSPTLADSRVGCRRGATRPWPQQCGGGRVITLRGYGERGYQ